MGPPWVVVGHWFLEILGIMSDLSIALEQSHTQLPVSAYFSDELFRREMELIFHGGPRYLGHALAVPEVGDHYALPQEGEGRALVRSQRGIELISNVCRHRQAVMLRGRGNTKSNIVCPLHRWTCRPTPPHAAHPRCSAPRRPCRPSSPRRR